MTSTAATARGFGGAVRERLVDIGVVGWAHVPAREDAVGALGLGATVRPGRTAVIVAGPDVGNGPVLPPAIRVAMKTLSGVDADVAVLIVPRRGATAGYLALALRPLSGRLRTSDEAFVTFRAEEPGTVARFADGDELLAVLERAPQPYDRPLGTPVDGPQLLLWAAPDTGREGRVRTALRRYLATRTVSPLGQAACHLAHRPAGGAVRGAVVAESTQDALRLLDRFQPAPLTGPRPVVLMVPGQGAQYPRMAAGLYDREPVFTATMDTVFTLFGGRGRRLRADWLSDDEGVPMDDGSRAQPLLFAVGYALGKMVCGWGVRPAALLGHSVGELVAATLAGVFRLTDAVRLMDARVNALVGMPSGGMLAVAASAAEIRPLLPGGDRTGVAVAALNAPRQTLLAGPDAALDAVEQKLRGQGLTCRRAKAKQGFHSPMMLPVARATEPVVAASAPRAPATRLFSAYTGGLMSDETARDVVFWSRQLADPVLFWPALNALLGSGDYLLVEAGPGQSLTHIARQHPAVRTRSSDVVSLLPARPGGTAGERHAVLSAAGRLWLDGHQLRREAFLDGAVSAPR